MTIKQASKELRKTVESVRWMIRNGKFKARKNKYSNWIIDADSFDEYLIEKARFSLLKRINLSWYFKCQKEASTNLSLKRDQIAEPWEVSIKNYLPVLTKDQYSEVCRISEERNK